jgi:hypothetical protein
VFQEVSQSDFEVVKKHVVTFNNRLLRKGKGWLIPINSRRCISELRSPAVRKNTGEETDGKSNHPG